mgnify:CR=1 FL=1
MAADARDDLNANSGRSKITLTPQQVSELKLAKQMDVVDDIKKAAFVELSQVSPESAHFLSEMNRQFGKPKAVKITILGKNGQPDEVLWDGFDLLPESQRFSDDDLIEYDS